MTGQTTVKLSVWAQAMGISMRTAQRQARQGSLEAPVKVTNTGRYLVLVTPTERALLSELAHLRGKLAA